MYQNVSIFYIKNNSGFFFIPTFNKFAIFQFCTQVKFTSLDLNIANDKFFLSTKLDIRMISEDNVTLKTGVIAKSLPRCEQGVNSLRVSGPIL